MYKNNFNTNKEGHDIELNCCYDVDIARIEFEDNFTVIQNEGYGKSTVAYYKNVGNVPDHEEVGFTIKGTIADLIIFAKTNYAYYADIITVSGDELEEIKQEIINDYSPSVLKYKELNEYDLKDTGLEFVPLKDLITVEIRGYSQGDYAKVIYSPDDLYRAWGNKPVEQDLKNTFTHLFYDAPIYAQFDIDGKEYNYYEYVEDSYKWDADKFAEGVAKDSGVPVQELKEFLPEYPPYN